MHKKIKQDEVTLKLYNGVTTKANFLQPTKRRVIMRVATHLSSEELLNHLKRENLTIRIIAAERIFGRSTAPSTVTVVTSESRSIPPTVI